MATKNFDKMSDKSLKVLLNSSKTSDEEKATISAILDSRAEERANKPTEPTVVEVAPDQETEQTEEEKAAEAEKLEARRAVVEEMKAFMGNKAKVVPFNTATWVEGTIVSILDDARAKNPLWVVKTDDGKTIRKAYGSQLIEVSNEKGTIPARRPGGAKGPKVEYTHEQILQMLADATEKIGYTIEYTKDGKPMTGIIWSVMHEKRSNRVMLRIKLTDGSFAHKVWNTEYTISGDYDEKVVENNKEKLAKARKLAEDPSAALNFAKDELAALEKQFEALKAKIDAKKAEIEALEKTDEDAVEADENKDELE